MRNKKIKKVKKIKQPSIKRLKKEADRVFSIYIRMRDKGVCFTCGCKKKWQEQQNGHYVSRNYLATRYDEKNCHAQCVSCNVFRHGLLTTYALKLIKRYGGNILQELDTLKNKPIKMTISDYQSLIDLYNSKIKKLK